MLGYEYLLCRVTCVLVILTCVSWMCVESGWFKKLETLQSSDVGPAVCTLVAGLNIHPNCSDLFENKYFINNTCYVIIFVLMVVKMNVVLCVD